jgi:hypothetical protein
MPIAVEVDKLPPATDTQSQNRSTRRGKDGEANLRIAKLVRAHENFALRPVAPVDPIRHPFAEPDHIWRQFGVLAKTRSVYFRHQERAHTITLVKQFAGNTP